MSPAARDHGGGRNNRRAYDTGIAECALRGRGVPLAPHLQRRGLRALQDSRPGHRGARTRTRRV